MSNLEGSGLDEVGYALGYAVAVLAGVGIKMFGGNSRTAWVTSGLIAAVPTALMVSSAIKPKPKPVALTPEQAAAIRARSEAASLAAKERAAAKAQIDGIQFYGIGY